MQKIRIWAAAGPIDTGCDGPQEIWLAANSLERSNAGNSEFFCLAINAYLFEKFTDAVANHRLLRGLQHDAQRLLHPGRHGSVGCEHLFD